MAQPPRGNPRSISDQARDVFAERIRREAEIVDKATAAAAKLTPDWDSHPGFAESLIPVWGSAREAVADVYDGDIGGAAINTGLAVADAFGGPMIAKAVLKTAAKTASELAAPAAVKAAMKKASELRMRGKAPYSWRNTRDRMLARGDVKPYQEVHHALIPQRAKSVPDRIRNHPLNLKVMPEGPEGRTTHARIHHGVGKKNTPQRLERFNPLQRYIYGTPTWWKAMNLASGHAAAAGKSEWDKSQ